MSNYDLLVHLIRNYELIGVPLLNKRCDAISMVES